MSEYIGEDVFGGRNCLIQALHAVGVPPFWEVIEWRDEQRRVTAWLVTRIRPENHRWEYWPKERTDE